MPLSPDTRLGSYRITAQIGAGGMGEVYRARDLTLERDVAIKVLPENVAQDPERLARFEREARTLAALNHPNIAQIYGFERSGSIAALVMELVDGETLGSNGTIPLDEALSLAKQIAAALEVAHEQASFTAISSRPTSKYGPTAPSERTESSSCPCLVLNCFVELKSRVPVK